MFAEAVKPDALMRAAIQRDTEVRARVSSKNTFSKSHQTVHKSDTDFFTSQKCCKVGQHLARQRMYCSADMWYVQRSNNRVHQARLKLHYPGEAAKTFGKDLALKAAKCHNHKATFEKCCRWRQGFMREMEHCKLKTGAERRSCRQTVRARY